MDVDFAELSRKAVFGQLGRRVVWQPRIICWLKDKRFAGEPLPEPYEGMSLPEIYRSLGCAARPYSSFTPCVRKIEPDSVRRTERALNETDVELTTQTGAGTMTAIERFTPNSDRRIRLKWPVSSEEELKAAIWLVEHTAWEWNQEAYEAGVKEWAGVGPATINVPRINIQDLYILMMGVEGTIFALHDYGDTVRAYCAALDDCHERFLDVLMDSPIEILNFGDNVHSDTLPPSLFKEFVLPAYQRRCAQCHRGGKFVHAHWDGNTKPLLPFLRETGLDGVEAVTPKPQGDVDLEEIKAALGDEMFLIDGIPAVLFDDYFPVSELEDFTRRILDMFAPRLVLGISDEISSTGDIERLRVVGDIVEEFNAAG